MNVKKPGRLAKPPHVQLKQTSSDSITKNNIPEPDISHYDHASLNAKLTAWLHQDGPKTISSLETAFGQRSFALAVVLLMALPSTPVPTGGISHMLDLLTILIALEHAFGRKDIWLPARWRERSLPKLVTSRAVPAINRLIARLERYAGNRGNSFVASSIVQRIAGVFIFLFTLQAFIAPPFTGLDTLAAFAAVLVGVALLLEDAFVLILGVLIGLTGITVLVAFGDLTIMFIRHILELKFW